VGAAVFHASPTHAATEAAAARREVFEGKYYPRPAKLRFSTLIVLPDDEEILISHRDKEFWVINGHNLCYVHPPGRHTEQSEFITRVATCIRSC